MMNVQIRFAVAGCGLISRLHLQAIQAIEDAELCGVYDIQPEFSKKAAEEYDTQSFDSYEDLLQHSGADAVCICTPSHLHAPMALAAIRNEKHVLIEKPMALTLEDCDALTQAAALAKVKIGVVSQLRYSPSIARVKHALRAGALGIVTRCDLYMKYYRPQSYYDSGVWRGTQAMDGGGALMNQGIHGVDLVCHFMGEADRIFAFASTLVRDIDVEDTLTAIVEWKHGTQGVIQASTGDYPGFPRRIEINGERGCIILEEDRVVRWEVKGKAVSREYEEPEAVNTASTYNDAAAIDPSGHEAQLRNFIDAVRGEGVLLVNEAEGRRAIQLVLAAYQSASTGQAVSL